MSAARPRLGIAGFGLIGRKHAEVIRSHGGAELVAVADPGPAAAASAERLGLTFHADAAALIETGRLDGLIVATPNAQHVPVACAALARGIPVLIEKPVAESVAAAAPLRAAARHTGAGVLVGHHRRHNPRLKAMRDAVQSGSLGRLTTVTALFLIKKPDAYFDVAWRREAGGGPILINLIHDIDNLRFVCGEITAVQAMTASGVRGHAVEDSAALLLRFANGALGTATLSDAVAAPWSWELASGENPMYPHIADAPCYLFAGTRGALQAPNLETWSYAGAEGWDQPLSRGRRDVTDADPLILQLGHFLDIIAGRAAPLVSLDDALGTLAVVEAIKAAARSGTIVHPETFSEQAA
jgi:predicted dehydrogenase